jgi:NADPH2:quinone reductase
MDVASAGVNYADTHQVEDSYLSRTTLPLVPGSEVVGRLPDGRRVAAFAMGGGYAEKALVTRLGVPAAGRRQRRPGAVAHGPGLTAWHLLRTSTHLAQGESVVVHAAAGGVGTLAVQLAKAWGAGTVIGVASSQDKRDLATSLGADVTVDAARPTSRRRSSRPTAAGRSTSCSRWSAGRRSTPRSRRWRRSAAWRRSAWPRASRPRRSSRCADVAQPRRHRLLAGALLLAPGDARPAHGRAAVHGRGRHADADRRRDLPAVEAHRAHEALLDRSSQGKLVLDCTA